MDSSDPPDFSGKVVIFYLANTFGTASNGIVLEYVEPRLLGGRMFYVGRHPEKSASRWVAKLQGAVAWEAVVHYLVFDSREEYERRVAHWSARPSLFQRLLGGGAG
jgi:hypothetical protein